MSVATMGAPPADPMMLLRDVGEIEEMRERPRQQQRRLHRHRRERGREGLEGAGIASACGLGQSPNVLDGAIQLVAFPGA